MQNSSIGEEGAIGNGGQSGREPSLSALPTGRLGEAAVLARHTLPGASLSQLQHPSPGTAGLKDSLKVPGLTQGTLGTLVVAHPAVIELRGKMGDEGQAEEQAPAQAWGHWWWHQHRGCVLPQDDGGCICRVRKLTQFWCLFSELL